MSAAAIQLSVIVKALNEAANIEQTLDAALRACEGLDAEVILADSLSSDQTVAIASRLPVTIVQLVNPADRGCGVGAQLGYQVARGCFILAIDGDMCIERDWLLAALRHLEANPRTAGVGGLLDDVNMENIEYRARQKRSPRDMKPGEVDRLNGGGLFRREALEDVEYFTNRNLHACEELELALRLRARGWRLERLDRVAIHHFGHTAPMWQLIRRRWASRYVCGAGELIRSAVGTPYFAAAVASFRLSLAVLGWWLVLLVLAAAAVWWPSARLALAVVLLLPPVAMLVRKRDVALASYSILSWCVDAAGLLRGFTSRQIDPRTPIAARFVERIEVVAVMGPGK